MQVILMQVINYAKNSNADKYGCLSRKVPVLGTEQAEVAGELKPGSRCGAWATAPGWRPEQKGRIAETTQWLVDGK